MKFRLILLAAPALAQEGGMQGMDHGKMAGMEAGMMMNTPGNPYAPAEMDMH